MDKFSYNSCPDSAESSPRSREIDFENPPPWEDQNQNHQQSLNKVKFMCSYGGNIQPRQHDNQLTYINGDTKLISVDRSIRFSALVSKLSNICSGEISFKYQLPGEDLDALISVSNDDDLDHMMHEYDRLVRMSSKPARLRLFLFSSSPISDEFGDSEGSIKSDKNPSRFESEKSVTAPPNNVEFLIGTEKVSAPIPPPLRPVAMEPAPKFVNPPIIQPNHGVNPADIQRQIQEFQRIQISDDQEQQQHHQNQLHQPNHGLNPAEIQRQIHEFQRIQIRDQEQLQQQYQNQMHHQQQEAIIHQNQLHHQRQEEAIIHQNQLHHQQQQEAIIHKNQMYQQQQEAIIHQNQMHQQQQEVITHQNQLQQQQQEAKYRRKSEDEAGRYFPEQQQQVYMISSPSPSPGTLYQNVKGSYYHDGYMEQQNQQGYNLVQPQLPYSQMAKPVYYTTPGEGMMVQPQVHQPQYQGMGQTSGMTDHRTRPSGD